MILRNISNCSMLLLALVVVSGCASYSTSSGHSTHGYYYQAGGAYYPSRHVYYGAYQPGWFVAAPYYPGNYWGYGAMVYWPTYASSYYYRSHYYGGYNHGRYYRSEEHTSELQS
ncbi:MAG TPA: hypothetical protein VFG52_03180, partial [Xanthomonadales bacterium]|nr:hypothetical protein [Xanthomonadales bacterium]